MTSGRRHVKVQDAPAWVFNRMVEAYSARPPYPEELLAELAVAARGERRVLDLGAGLGHVALPLAARGLCVTAVEPAQFMLEQLVQRAEAQGLCVRPLHAKVEELPLPNAAFDLIVVADALHFFDVERAAREIDRLLAPGAALAVLTVGHDQTPFMRAVSDLIDATAARKVRPMVSRVQQLFRLARVTKKLELTFRDATPVSAQELDAILHSISFVGPAFSAERRARFREHLAALGEERVWARRMELQLGRASLRRRPKP